MIDRRALGVLLTFTALLSSATLARAALDATDTTWDGSTPPQGVYFHWYEPSFYTGFAPRTQDPSRLHIHLSRGNQVRVTVVLGDADLDAYLEDLQQRRAVYQELLDSKVMQLTTNKEYERFTQRLDEVGVAAAAASRTQLGPDAYRAKSVEIMTALNPDRIFRIHIPIDSLARAWHATLTAASLDSTASKLDAANAALPGRVNLHDLSPQLDSALNSARAAAAGGADSAEFRSATQSFIEQATLGHYRVKDGAVEAVELTTIYPAGTADATTMYKGEKLPDFGVTGVWPLIRRSRGRGLVGMVDYLSPNPGYGFITMLPYQDAGGITYNAFHNAGVRCALGQTPFLPSAWRKGTSDRDGKSFQNLWIISRGPTSHGCTRLASGHMSEMRQIVPSESDTLTQVETFRNLAGCFDVFDVQGDGTPEVMGVQYYLAYKNKEHTPIRSYVSNAREPFYRWLYGDKVALGPVGQTKITEAPVCRFVGRKAQEASVSRDVPLYEPVFAPEPIQFYKIKGAAFDSTPGYEFNRELRKVGAGHTLDRKKLLLK